MMAKKKARLAEPTELAEEIAAVVAEKVAGYGTLSPVQRQELSSAMFMGIARELLPELGYDATKWGAEAAADQLRRDYEYARRPTWRDHHDRY